MLIEDLLEKPMWQMTGQEVLSLLRSALPDVKAPQEKEPEMGHGIAGIAEILNCSPAKAQQIKNTGYIDDALYQAGRTILINREKLLEVYKKNEIRIKQKIRNTKSLKK